MLLLLSLCFYVWFSFLIPYDTTTLIFLTFLHYISDKNILGSGENKKETMSEIEKQNPQEEEEEESSATWPDIEEELVIPEVLHSEGVKKLHTSIQSEWDYLQKSACQTAAGRALWKHVIHDPLAHLFAGETHLRNLHTKIQNDRVNNAREVSGVILAVRTLWFDTKIQAALDSFHGDAAQVVLLGAGLVSSVYTFFDIFA